MKCPMPEFVILKFHWKLGIRNWKFTNLLYPSQLLNCSFYIPTSKQCRPYRQTCCSRLLKEFCRILVHSPVYTDRQIGVFHSQLVDVFKHPLVERLSLIADLRNSHALYKIDFSNVRLDRLERCVRVDRKSHFNNLVTTHITSALFEYIVAPEYFMILDGFNMENEPARPQWKPFVDMLLRLRDHEVNLVIKVIPKRQSFFLMCKCDKMLVSAHSPCCIRPAF